MCSEGHEPRGGQGAPESDSPAPMSWTGRIGSGLPNPNRVSKFASILRSWQATRPLPMRRPKAEASHEPPYIEDLLDEAAPHLKVLGDL